MVQVDVFWSYALGAGFALAAARQIAQERPRSAAEVDDAGPAWWQAESFVKTLLFLALVFVPSGTYLLAEFPSWETMHVTSGRDSVPSWGVTAFTLTNVSQGILGYWVVRKLILAKRWRLAQSQWLLGYFGMFFVLVHGWDGTGYVRFFSAEPSWIASWQPVDAARWLVSPVALSLAVMGVFLLPPLLGWMSRWLQEGYALDPTLDPTRSSRVKLIGLVLFGALGLALGSAIAASVCVRLLGWALGGAAFALLAWAVLLRERGLLWRYGESLLLAQPGSASKALAPAGPAQAVLAS